MSMQFEYTARDTPQQNHLAELGLAVLANRGRAMMHYANVPKDIKMRVFTKAFETATLLDSLLVIEIEGKTASRYEHFHGHKSKITAHLRTWGKAGTVKTKRGMIPKTDDRGLICMMVGYAVNHGGDCYEMWDPSKGTIHLSQVVIWLQRMYYPRKDGIATT